MRNLSVAVATGILNNMSDYQASDFDALGISEQDFDLITQTFPWKRHQIARVMRTMNAMIFGSLEILGMPKLVVPSEYVAAVIASVVAPANMMTACTWLAQERQTGIGALDLSARAALGEVAPTSAEQLFALVCVLMSQERTSAARRNLALKLGVAEQNTREQPSL